MSTRTLLVICFVLAFALAAGGAWMMWERGRPAREQQRRQLETSQRLREIGQSIMAYTEQNKGLYPRTSWTTHPASQE